jgi:hypothetical protein
MSEKRVCADFADAINEMVDETLEPVGAGALAAHLNACAGCRAVLADLRRIKTTAASLERHAPSAHVRAMIQSQLTADSAASRRARPDWRWLAVAAAAMLAITAAAGYWLRSADPGSQRVANAPAGSAAPGAAPDRPETAAGNSGSSGSVESIEAELKLAEEHYANAITALEQAARSQEQTLDPQVAATLRNNLAIIDAAIAESRMAMRSAPESTVAQESLFEALRRKAALLQDTIALMNEMRKGNQAGAAQIVEGLSKS